MSESFLFSFVSSLTGIAKVKGLLITGPVSEHFLFSSVSRLISTAKVRGFSHYQTSVRAVPVLICEQFDRYCQGKRTDSFYQTSVKGVPVLTCEQADRYCEGERTAPLQDQHQSCFSYHLCGCVLMCRLRACLLSSVQLVPLWRQPAVKHLKV